MSNFFGTPWTVAHQTLLSFRFPRQEYWSGFPFPSPGDLPDPGIKSKSPALAGVFVFFFSPQPLIYQESPGIELYCMGKTLWETEITSVYQVKPKNNLYLREFSESFIH